MGRLALIDRARWRASEPGGSLFARRCLAGGLLAVLFAFCGKGSFWAQVSPPDELTAASRADKSGHYQEAVRYYEKFLASQTASPLSASVIDARTRLATADFLLHRYRESLEALRPLPFDSTVRATTDKAASSKAPGGMSGPSRGPHASPIPLQAWLVRGLDYLDLNRLADAIPSLRQALALNPDSGTARLALGDALARSGQAEEAADEYREQSQRTPDVGDAWYKLGMIYLELGQKPAFASQRAGPLLAVRLAAEQRADRGDYWGSAQALFPIVHASASSSAAANSAATVKPSLPGSTILQPGLQADLGTALLRLGYPRAAGQQFKAELSQDPESLPALLGKVEIEAFESEWEGALGDFQRLMAEYPTELPLRLESPPSAGLSEAWKQGRIALPSRLALSPAGKLLSRWLGSDGLESPPRPEAGKTSCSPPPPDRQREPGYWMDEACAAQFREELGSRERLSQSQTVKLIEIDYRLGHYEESRARARTLLRSTPKDDWAAYWLAKSYSALAGQCFAQLAQLDPGSLRVHEILARSDSEQNRLSAARHEYEAALRLAPDLPDLHLGLGTVAWLAGDWTSAEGELKKTMALAPGSTVAAYELGDSYTQQHRWQQAIDNLKPALRDPAVERRARLDLAKAEGELGDLNAALKDLLLLAPGDRDGEVHYRLAALYRKAGDNAKAQVALAVSETLRRSSDQLSQQRLEALEREGEGVGHLDPN